MVVNEGHHEEGNGMFIRGHDEHASGSGAVPAGAQTPLPREDRLRYGTVHPAPVAHFVFQLQAVVIFTQYRDFFPCFADIAMFEDFQGCR